MKRFVLKVKVISLVNNVVSRAERDVNVLHVGIVRPGIVLP